MHFTEAHFENAILELMRDTLGYDYIYGPSVEREYTEPLHIDLVQQSLYAINPTLPREAIEVAISKIRTIEGGSLVQRNEVFHDYLQNGVEINCFDRKEQCVTRVKLIDYAPYETTSRQPISKPYRSVQFVVPTLWYLQMIYRWWLWS